MFRTALALSALIAGCSAAADTSTPEEVIPTAMYMANEGLLVSRGDTKVIFDPLYDQTYGQYLPLPAQMKLDLMLGEPPFDGVDVVFVSHFHGDHFAPEDMLNYLRSQPDVLLVAPRQAVDAMIDETGLNEADPFMARITAIDLEYKDAPMVFELSDILVEAVRIPHAGWPTGRVNIQNIAFRVTLDGETTLLHMGDADIDTVHYSHDADYWAARPVDMAFPPYWYLMDETGRLILADTVGAQQSVGVHVPAAIPAEDTQRPAEYRGLDIFTTPGETRQIID